MPNPFSSSTTIRYSLATRGHVTLEVFDVTGRSISTLVDGMEQAGVHSATWSGRDRAGHELPAGVYFYRLSGPTFDPAEYAENLIVSSLRARAIALFDHQSIVGSNPVTARTNRGVGGSAYDQELGVA